jgi:hypothetical protein
MSGHADLVRRLRECERALIKLQTVRDRNYSTYIRQVRGWAEDLLDKRVPLATYRDWTEQMEARVARLAFPKAVLEERS